MIKTIFYYWLLVIFLWPIVILCICSIRHSLIKIMRWPLERIQAFMNQIGHGMLISATFGSLLGITIESNGSEVVLRILLAILFVIIGLKIITMSSER